MQGMRGHWISIVAIALSTPAATLARSPDAGFVRAQQLFRQTDYARVIEALEAAGPRDAAGYALIGKALLMEGRYKEAVANLEKAVAADNLNSGYYDWLGRAYGCVAEASSFTSAFGYARKTVHSFERAVELDPSTSRP